MLKSMNFVYCILQTSALVQFRVKDHKSIFSSRFLTTYSTLTCAICFIAIFHSIFFRVPCTTAHIRDVTTIIEMVELIGVRISHFVSILESIIHQKEMRKFYEKLTQVDELFEKKLLANLQHQKTRKTVLLKFFSTTALYFGSQIVVLALYNTNNYLTSSCYWSVHLIPLVGIALSYLQTHSAVFLLKVRFDQLNESLKNVSFVSKEVAGKVATKRAVAELETEHQMQRASTKNEESAYERIAILRDIYDKLWNLTELINQCFGISWLMNIGIDFILITSNCYFMFLTLRSSTVEVVRTLRAVVWSIPHFYNVVLIASVCHWTVQSTSDTRLIAHKIEIDSTDIHQSTLIEQFSLQMLHQKVQFTAYGFFSIDFTLLYAIVGATTTYLVILIQFNPD